MYPTGGEEFVIIVSGLQHTVDGDYHAMRWWAITVAAALALLSTCVPAQSHLNRVATTSFDAVSSVFELVFTDADSMLSTRHPLPSGFAPGKLIAMDRFGGVWLDRRDYASLSSGGLTNEVWRFDSFGQHVAVVTTSVGYVREMTTDAQANLIAVSSQTGVTGACVIERFSGSGALLQSASTAALLPSGVSPIVRRPLVASDGSCWVTFEGGLLQLDPNFGVANTLFGMLVAYAMPDTDRGVRFRYDTANYPGPPAPGFQFGWGWAHVDGAGAIVSQTQGLPAVAEPTRVRTDDLFLGVGAIGTSVVAYDGLPGVGNSGIAVSLPCAAANCQGYGLAQRGLHLDGRERLWALGHRSSTGSAVERHWTRVSHVGGIATEERLVGGVAYLVLGESQYGDATLHTYAMYTDPLGDLDGDGVPNQAELRTGTNPFVSDGVTSIVSVAPPGGRAGVFWHVPQDGGMLYFAPLVGAPAPTALGSGFTLPFSPSDPMVLYTLMPNAAITGSTGTLDASGVAAVSISVPPLPSLSGSSVWAGLVTVDPSSPFLFRRAAQPVSVRIL